MKLHRILKIGLALFPLTVWGAQEIPLDQVHNVFSKMEGRVTNNPVDGKTYIWGRFIGVSGPYQKWRYCYMAAVSNIPVAAVNLSNGTSTNIYTYQTNKGFFITNIININGGPLDQETVDWCLQ